MHMCNKPYVYKNCGMLTCFLKKNSAALSTWPDPTLHATACAHKADLTFAVGFIHVIIAGHSPSRRVILYSWH